MVDRGTRTTRIKTKTIVGREVDPLMMMRIAKITTSMSLEIKSIKRRKLIIRSLEQIIMLPRSQRTIIKSRTEEENNPITKRE